MPLDAALIERLTAAIDAQMPGAFAELGEIVAIPSVADPALYPPQDCLRAAQWVAQRLEAAGLSAGLYETPDGTSAVIARTPPVPDAPTVLLYCHYDVQPPLDEDAWHTPPFTLTEVDGRWFGRGSADCKGNLEAHLMALRALQGTFPCNVIVVSEGSEEQGTGGLEQYVAAHPDQIRADAMLICDSGNVAAGIPTLTTALRGVADAIITVRSADGPLHSGAFGGPAPDALFALIKILASLRNDAGDTTITGLDNTGVWPGVGYPAQQFAADAGLVPGAEVIGSGAPADMLWARPAVTVLGIDAPPVVGSTASIPGYARARINLRLQPGVSPEDAQRLIAAHVKAATPWGVEVEVEPAGNGDPFAAKLDGPAVAALSAAMEAAFGHEVVTSGQGGAIPLTAALQKAIPEAEIVVMGALEPGCRMHAPNESVLPGEIRAIALAEALFISTYAGASASNQA